MKSAPYPTNSTTWTPSSLSSLLEPPTRKKLPKTAASSSTLKMKTTTKSRKRPSPTPLPSISTLLESGSSSHSSSSNSSYGSYCQFSPEGSYTMYHWPMNYFPYIPEPTDVTTTTPQNAMTPMPTTSRSTEADEHTPITQPLFIQTADPYDYTASDPTGGYPSSATINASQLLLRPVPNGVHF